MQRRVVAIACSPQDESVGFVALRELTEQLGRRDVRHETVLLRRLPAILAGLDLDAYPACWAGLQRSVASADGVALAVPVHRSKVSGAARNLVEQLRDAVRGKPCVLVVAAGSVRSTLAAQEFEADLRYNFSAEPVARTVLVTAEDVDQAESRDRLAGLAVALANALAARRPDVPTNQPALVGGQE